MGTSKMPEVVPHAAGSIRTRSPNICFQHFKGIISCLLCGASTVGFGVLAKVAKRIDVMELVFVARIGMIALLFPIAVYRGLNPLGPKGDRIILLSAGVTHLLSVYFDNISCRYLPLAIAMTLSTTHQAITAILGRIILKEPLNAFKIIGALLSIIGIILTCRLHQVLSEGNIVTFSSSEHGVGFAAAMSGSVLRALSLLLIRKAKSNHYLTTTFTNAFSGLVVCIALCPALSTLKLPLCNWEQYVLPSSVVFVTFGLVFRIVAARLEDITIVAIVISSWQVILSFFLQIFAFGNIPDAFVITGALFLILSIVTISTGKWIKHFGI